MHRMCGLARRFGFQVLSVVINAAQHSLPRLQAAEFADGSARPLRACRSKPQRVPTTGSPSSGAAWALTTTSCCRLLRCF